LGFNMPSFVANGKNPQNLLVVVARQHRVGGHSTLQKSFLTPWSSILFRQRQRKSGLPRRRRI
jgi:hypothetical protein